MTTHEEILSTVETLIHTGEINGLYYSSSVVHAEGHNGVPDADVKNSQLLAATILRRTGEHQLLETALYTPEYAAGDVDDYYSMVLDSGISQEVFDAISQSTKNYWSSMETQVSPSPLYTYVQKASGIFEAPVSVLVQHRILESDVITPNERRLQLFYPYFIGPRIILDGMKRAIKNTRVERTETFWE